MRWFTGPTREEMGLPPESELPPHVIDPPIPYTPGTEKGFGFTPTPTPFWTGGVKLAAALWVLALLFAILYGLVF